MDKRIIKPYIEKFFKTSVLPNLMEFIKIENISPAYDQDWEKKGFMMDAARYLVNYVQNLYIKNAEVNLLKEDGHTPFIYIDIKGTQINTNKTIVFYGHLDKQPAFTGWSEGKGPQKPVIIDNKLYGRGSSDDGYAIFAAIAAVKACQDNSFDLPRIVILIEGAEESYTDDLFFYVNNLKSLIGNPSLIVCLDSGCSDYERLWISTSLRGVFGINLKVSVMNQGIHSGLGGGLIPDSFLILRTLLERIEDSKTGDIKVQSLYVDIPEKRLEQIDNMINIVGDKYLKSVPWYGNTGPIDKNIKDTIIRNTWKPTLTITGCDGLPENNSAGNVLRPYTELKLSIRLPPGVDADKAGQEVKEILEKDHPFNSTVEADLVGTGAGWNLCNFSEKLDNILNIASQRYFDNDRCFFGEGGSVPFVKLFNDMFPKSDFAVLGVCGPTSNIHGPDENLRMDFCQKLMMCLSFLISEY
jgi:acetylornithine deacetylase/succinyl-diaminopimelate desuccinylase-like protein